MNEPITPQASLSRDLSLLCKVHNMHCLLNYCSNFLSYHHCCSSVLPPFTVQMLYTHAHILIRFSQHAYSIILLLFLFHKKEIGFQNHQATCPSSLNKQGWGQDVKVHVHFTKSLCLPNCTRSVRLTVYCPKQGSALHPPLFFLITMSNDYIKKFLLHYKFGVLASYCKIQTITHSAITCIDAGSKSKRSSIFKLK